MSQFLGTDGGRKKPPNNVSLNGSSHEDERVVKRGGRHFSSSGHLSIELFYTSPLAGL